MQKVKLTNAWVGTMNTKFGAKLAAAIKTEQHGDQRLMCFINDKQEDRYRKELQEGTEVNVVVSKRGEYLNFRLPTSQDFLEHRVSKLEKAVGIDKDEPEEVKVAPTSNTPQSNGVNSIEDIPF